jgi:hypothetical protein
MKLEIKATYFTPRDGRSLNELLENRYGIKVPNAPPPPTSASFPSPLKKKSQQKINDYSCKN